MKYGFLPQRQQHLPLYPQLRFEIALPQNPIKPVKPVKPIRGADWLTGLTTLIGYFAAPFSIGGTS
jgi:hypothetical protein